MIRIATLGPAGTNHEMVSKRYMRFHGIENFQIDLVDAFPAAVEKLMNDEADIIIQCAVHPATPTTMGASFRKIFVADCFIADSQELGVVSRRDVENPKKIGLLMPATADYTDLSRWETHENVRSLPIVFEMLMAGEIDSGLIYTSYADRHPETLRVDEVIGSPDDAWIVYSKKRMSHLGGILASKDAPFAKELQAMAKEKNSEIDA